jgi:VanZ family protein
MLIGIVFGAFTEVMQRYVFTGRNANIYDFFANVLGCFVGLAVYYVINRKLKKNIRVINN